MTFDLETSRSAVAMATRTLFATNCFSGKFWKSLSAFFHNMMGTFMGATSLPGTDMKRDIKYIVSKVQGLNLLGRTASDKLGISLDEDGKTRNDK